MREITTKVYMYDELSEDVREKVLEKMWDVNVSHEWWDFVYMDAEEIGLEIKEFDLDRGLYCRGKWIAEAKEAADKILEKHGETCETHKDALHFKTESEQTQTKFEQNENYDSEYEEFEDSEEYETACDEFLKVLLEDYRSILQKEYDYLTGREAIEETIRMHEWEFTEDGKIWL